MSTIIELDLQDLTCNHCINRVKQALEAVTGVTHAEVTLDHAQVTGSAAAGALIAAVQQAGYQAQQAEASTAPKPRR